MIAKTLGLVSAVCGLGMSAALAANGSWTFGTEDRGHPLLVYAENGK